MKPAHMAAALFGLVVAAALIVHFGADAVGSAITAVGWHGLALVSLAHFASLVLCGLAWSAVLASPVAKRRRIFLWARYVRDSLGNLVGIIPATGEIAAARELTFFGVGPADAAASAIVDMTAELLSQVLFTVAGLAILLWIGVDAGVAKALVAGVGLAAAAVVGFFLAQRHGLLRLLETLPEKLGFATQWAAFSDQQSLHDAVAAVYAAPWRLPASIGLHLAGWGFAALETWIVLRLMQSPVSLAEAMALESLVFAARTSAFFVPWAAGVQEGGYVIVGGLLGLPPSTALALSVLKRAREILFGAPGLLAWQLVESRRLARRRARKETTAD